MLLWAHGAGKQRKGVGLSPHNLPEKDGVQRNEKDWGERCTIETEGENVAQKGEMTGKWHFPRNLRTSKLYI